jgi:hypothetical protein
MEKSQRRESAVVKFHVFHLRLVVAEREVGGLAHEFNFKPEPFHQREELGELANPGGLAELVRSRSCPFCASGASDLRVLSVLCPFARSAGPGADAGS